MIIKSKELIQLNKSTAINNKKFGCIFVRGLSRSGGTILTTVLDSHKEISMSYELYPNMLERLGIDNILYGLKTLQLNKKISNIKELQLLNTFLLRAERSGINKDQFIEILRILLKKNSTIEKFAYTFVEELSKTKMLMEKKSIWGAKCSQFFNGYIENYKNPFFFGIIRDGRDVCVSQLKNLKKNDQSIEKVANNWVTYVNKLIELNENYENSHLVIYEQLVNSPEEEIKKICNKLNIVYDKKMMNHDQQDLTIYKSHHLSMSSLIKPINNKSVGLWKKNMNSKDIKKFNDIAKGYLEKFNYEI